MRAQFFFPPETCKLNSISEENQALLRIGEKLHQEKEKRTHLSV